MMRAVQWQAQTERTAATDFAGNYDVAAMFPENLAADGQPEPSRAGPLGADKRSKDVGDPRRRDPGAVVADIHPQPVSIAVRRHGHRRLVRLLDGVEGVTEDVEQRPVEPLGV